jgi:hypothetical protein
MGRYKAQGVLSQQAATQCAVLCALPDVSTPPGRSCLRLRVRGHVPLVSPGTRAAEVAWGGRERAQECIARSTT